MEKSPSRKVAELVPSVNFQVDRKAKRHQRRMAEDIALNITSLSDEKSSTSASASAAHDKTFVDALEPILRLKCDVSVVSTYHQLFVLADAIFQSGLWTAEP